MLHNRCINIHWMHLSESQIQVSELSIFLLGAKLYDVLRNLLFRRHQPIADWSQLVAARSLSFQPGIPIWNKDTISWRRYKVNYTKSQWIVFGRWRQCSVAENRVRVAADGSRWRSDAQIKSSSSQFAFIFPKHKLTFYSIHSFLFSLSLSLILTFSPILIFSFCLSLFHLHHSLQWVTRSSLSLNTLRALSFLSCGSPVWCQPIRLLKQEWWKWLSIQNFPLFF